jgi:lambda repressor-like predicted transcriptional regulator
MAGKGRTEVVEGIGDRVTLLLRRHAVINTALALGEAAGLSRQTVHRALNEDSLTRETGRAIAAALGVEFDEIWPTVYQPLGERLISSHTVTARNEATPATYMAPRNLPQAVREFLAHVQLELTKAHATEEEVEATLSLLKSPEMFSFYEGGAPKDFTEEQMLQSMKAIYNGAIKPELKRRGRKFA